MDIIESIKKQHLELSKSEQKVSSYIIKHPDNIETFTITKLANEAKTSTSAVLRFCQSLGFQGYKEFRFEILNYLHNRRQKANPNDLINNYLTDYAKVINQMQQIDHKQIDYLIDCLMNDELNYLLGIYYSSFPAKELYYGLSDLGKPSLYSNDYINSAHITRTMKNSSTLVLFSVSGNKQDFSNFLPDLTNDMPPHSFLITLNPKAELSKIFPETIILPGSVFSNRSVTDGQSIPILFVEMLLNLIHEKI